MAEENAKTVLVSNAGFLGFLDRGTFREVWNYSFAMKAIVLAKDLRCQRVCLSLIPAGVLAEHTVFLENKDLFCPDKIFAAASSQVKGVLLQKFVKMPVQPFQVYLRSLIAEFRLSDAFCIKQPVRMIGLQEHLLESNDVGEDQWLLENIEFFFHPRLGVLGADGNPYPGSQSIWDPVFFRHYHNIDEETLESILVKHEESGRDGLLERFDYPYCTRKAGWTYFEEINILFGFLYLANSPVLNYLTGFNGSLLVMGSTGVGKTSLVMAGLGLVSSIQYVISSGSSLAFVRMRLHMISMANALDDTNSMRNEENLAVEGSQGMSQGTKTYGIKKQHGKVASSTNMQKGRSDRLTNGRVVTMFKNMPSMTRSEDASKDVDDVISHNRAMHSAKKPLQFVCSMSAQWFEPSFLDEFKKATELLYKLVPHFTFRKIVPYSGVLMMAFIVDKLVMEAKEEARKDGNSEYPGQRWEEEGGLEKYLEYVKVWLGQVEEFGNQADDTDDVEEDYSPVIQDAVLVYQRWCKSQMEGSGPQDQEFNLANFLRRDRDFIYLRSSCLLNLIGKDSWATLSDRVKTIEGANLSSNRMISRDKNGKAVNRRFLVLPNRIII